MNRGSYTITTDQSQFDLEAIHRFLSEQSYWAKGVPREVVERSLKGSLCFGVLKGREQVGLARVITDGAVFAYLCDVYILPEHRGQGLSKWLMETIVQHPELQGLRKWMLATQDAHGLYAQFGFSPLRNPDRVMEIARPRLYEQAIAAQQNTEKEK